ncbi:MAG TPA: maleylpyruvate isomerase family mycothiol-dependent enzyme [Acidimicrobiales bacterium]|nr:maleylpyruvate isomerase family mycothiol-dependent enzyme [Acidimicrobiales bacterium]
MTLERPLALIEIESHAHALAAIAPRSWDAPIEGCPGWRVEDVVRHLCQVHWFWERIVARRLDAPPVEDHPATPGLEGLAEHFEAGAARLVATLAATDPGSPVWTWAPAQRDVAFVTRHQVQEMAVHHYDVARAVGEPWSMTPVVAADAVEEFLTFSVSSPLDPADPPRPPLGGRLALVARDADAAWTVVDAGAGTVTWSSGVVEPSGTLEADAHRLLLWLYGRVDVEGDDPGRELGARLRALAFTD